MIIIGQVSSEEERYELQFIAQIFSVEKRFRDLARMHRKNK
jgi:hypothetical protein